MLKTEAGARAPGVSPFQWGAGGSPPGLPAAGPAQRGGARGFRGSLKNCRATEPLGKRRGQSVTLTGPRRREMKILRGAPCCAAGPRGQHQGPARPRGAPHTGPAPVPEELSEGPGSRDRRAVGSASPESGRSCRTGVGAWLAGPGDVKRWPWVTGDGPPGRVTSGVKLSCVQRSQKGLRV